MYNIIHIWCIDSLDYFQAVRKRTELKLIVTSATLDAVKFSQHFYEAVSRELQYLSYFYAPGLKGPGGI